MLFLGQCVFATIVVFVLKGFLDKELVRAALENFESCKTSSDIKEIAVRSASSISDEFKGQFESIRRRKFAQAHLDFQEDSALKGGIVIAVGDLLLDFSLTSRLKNFWS
jgi:F0F1-type ATP synthase delta subunit